MELGNYKGYRIFDHAILQQEDILSPERYGGSGTIARDRKMVEASRISVFLIRKKKLSSPD